MNKTCKHIFSRNSHNSSLKHFNATRKSHIQYPEQNGTNHLHQLFDEKPQWDVVSATALISDLAKQNRHKESIFAFSRMLHLEFKPNSYTFGTVIHSSVVLQDLHLGQQFHAHAEKLGLNSNVFVGSALLDLYVKLSSIDNAQKAFDDTHMPNVVSYSTLIRGYIKEGRLEDGTRIFRSMPERNAVSWNTMISGCSQMGYNEEAVDFFIEMWRNGVNPSHYTFPCVMTAAANIAAVGMGRSFHACAVKFFGSLDLFFANSLMSFYAKCGSMEDSLLIFNRMSSRNVVSWNVMVCGYAQNGQGKEAVEMFQKMKMEGFRPNGVTFLGLLLGCNHVGLIDEGYKYFTQARVEDLRVLKPEHYACMVDLLSRSGRFEEAGKFVKDLPFVPGIGFWKAMLGGCQIHGNLELGEIAARKILELDPGDVSSYVMLSNAHSAAGRWQSVLKIRHEMRDKGLKRTPGSSWIEIKSKVHVFVTGDERHRERHQIYVEMRFLLNHMMDRHDMDSLVSFRS